jgi:DNA-binding LacI/PurR family transcriptional regulator
MGSTIREVALAAGVSTATVSRVLHEFPGVRPGTRAAVAAAAKQLNYVPSVSAARLRSGRTGVVALLITESSERLAARLIRVMHDELRSAELDCVVHFLGRGSDQSDGVARRLRGAVDGTIALAVESDTWLLDVVTRLDLPGVAISAAPQRISTIWTDDDLVGKLAATWLGRLGYAKFVVIGGGMSGTTANGKRAHAFVRELTRHQRAVSVERRETSDIESARRVMATVLALRSQPTAVFATDDAATFGADQALRDAGPPTPEGVALLGCADDRLVPVLEVPMVVLPYQDLGRQAASTLLREMSRPRAKPVRTLLTPALAGRPASPAPTVSALAAAAR